MSLHEERRELLEILFQRSFRYADTPCFTLASGKKSHYYINGKATTLSHPRAQYLIGRLIFHRIKDLEIQGIGGLTLGADPIAVAVSLVSGLEGKPVPAFVVRKIPKAHGLGLSIEGDLPEHARVAVLDDVVTTGGSILQAVDALEAAGHRVVKALALVDRNEGGREALAQRGLTLEALYTIDDFMALHRASRAAGREGVRGGPRAG